MKNQALFSSKDKSKKLICRLLQFLFNALRVNSSFLACLYECTGRAVALLVAALGSAAAAGALECESYGKVFYVMGQALSGKLSYIGYEKCQEKNWGILEF